MFANQFFRGRLPFLIDLFTVFFFSTFDRDKCSGKSVDTTEKSALRLVKLHSVKVICWKSRNITDVCMEAGGEGGGGGVKALRFLWCRPIFPNLSISKVEKNRRLPFIFSVVSELLLSCSINIKLETIGKTDVDCSEKEISPVVVVH